MLELRRYLDVTYTPGLGCALTLAKHFSFTIWIGVSSIKRRMTVQAFLFFLCHSVLAGSEGSAEGDLPEVEEEGGMVGMGRVSSGLMTDQISRSSRTI